MRMPQRSYVRAMLFWLIFNGLAGLFLLAVTPDPAQATAGQRLSLYVLEMILPLATGAVASNIPWIAALAYVSIGVYAIAVTTRAFRSVSLALLALICYAYLTLATIWVEPWIVSVGSAVTTAVTTFVLKIGFGFFELVISLFWFLIPYPVRWQLIREFEDAAREEAAAPPPVRPAPAEPVTPLPVMPAENPVVWPVFIAYPLALGTLGVLIGLLAAFFVAANEISCMTYGGLTGALVGLVLAAIVFYAMRNPSVRKAPADGGIRA